MPGTDSVQVSASFSVPFRRMSAGGGADLHLVVAGVGLPLLAGFVHVGEVARVSVRVTDS